MGVDASRLQQCSSQAHAGERGQLLILAAVMMTTLLGVTALAIDASFMYDKRNLLHAAADAAAKSMAIELRRDRTLTTTVLKRFADQEIAALGFTPVACGAGGGVSICVNHPPATGPFSCASLPIYCNNYVEVLTSQVTPMFFGRILGWTSMTPGARAVSGPTPGPYCLIALGPNASGISIGLNSTINMPACYIGDNTNLSNGGTIIAGGVDVHGTCTGNCQGVAVNAQRVTDPLLSLSAPADPGCPASYTPCTAMLTLAGTVTLDPGKYAGWKFLNGANVTLRAGLYYLTGSITALNNITLTGAGVTIYLAPGSSLSIDKNDPVVTLSAPTSGAYTGILFYQDRANTSDAILGKNSGEVTLSGAMYFPAAAVTTAKNNGGVVQNDCTVFVANSIFMMNNGDFANACTAYGGSPASTPSLAE
jgi:hypothetical protein